MPTSDYPEEISDYHEKQFVKGAKLSSRGEEYKTEGEWLAKGVKNFKRRVLGFCGKRTVKSLDELTEILTELKILDSKEEGKKFIRGLYGKEAYYNGRTLEFTKVQNEEGDEFCRIDRYGLELS